MADDPKPVTLEEVTKLLTEQNIKNEANITALRSAHDKRYNELLEKVAGEGKTEGQKTGLADELSRVKKEQSEREVSERISSAVENNNRFWKAQLSAKELGLTDDDIKAFPDASSLDAAVRILKVAKVRSNEEPNSGASGRVGAAAGSKSGSSSTKLPPEQRLAEALKSAGL